MELPQDVAAALAKGIGAYLRDAPATKVPASLRRFRSFRPQALTPHRAKLIEALEDDDFRNDIAEWLKDAPRLNKEEERLLTLAAKREEGWEQALAGSAQTKKKSPSRSEAERNKESLQRERDKVAKLKEELRSQRESSRDEVRNTKQRVSESQAEVRELKAQLRTAEAEVRSLRQESERRQLLVEKESRSLRREAERAAGAKSEAAERVTALKREVAALTRQKNELERRLHDELAKAERASASADRSTTKRGPRKRLKAPAGLLNDAPETLRAWLASDGVKLIVDGYNVGKAESGFPDVNLEAMRKRVIDEVAKLARQYSVEAIVVFDGAEVAPGTSRRTRGPVKIQYSKPGVIADDHIVELVEELPPDPIVVVTNDRELQNRVSRHHATVATSTQLLSLVR